MVYYIKKIKNVILIQLLFHVLYTSTNVVIPYLNKVLFDRVLIEGNEHKYMNGKLQLNLIVLSKVSYVIFFYHHQSQHLTPRQSQNIYRSSIMM